MSYMKYFLQQIAESLYERHGNTLDKHCLVFPNRRAGLFFMKYLAAEIRKPVWLPAILTINDLFYSLSDSQPAENEVLLFELYKVYRKIKKGAENFDDFYFWGDMLLNDFDDVDKYLVNTTQLFRNITDIKKIDEQFGGLTAEQVEIIKRFWINTDTTKLTREKAEFLKIWEILDDLYKEFRNVLAKKGEAYEGMIYRDVIERIKKDDSVGIRWDMVHFIGFNALNKCEKELMKWLKNNGKARFYWDYDNSYLKTDNLNSAGFFLRENIRFFGNDMPEAWDYDTMLSGNIKKCRIRVINTSSDVAQVKLLPQLLQDFDELSLENAHHTAIILADENLLVPVLTSLPEKFSDINITMGYPVRQTSVFIFVKQLLDLQMNSRKKNGVVLFNYRDVIKLLKNSFLRALIDELADQIITEITERNQTWIEADYLCQSEILSLVFIRTEQPALLSEYLKTILSLLSDLSDEALKGTGGAHFQKNIRNEFIYRIILSLNRLDIVAKSQDIVLTIETWIRILERIIRSQSVPFSGEPLAGIQVMGILETRTLDFRNIIMLSVNEGILPSVTVPSSFIPFTLREAFRMPSVNHQESIYAYHFYRLLHRAENVKFLYNSDSEGLRSGEMSRFLQQIKYDPHLKPEMLSTTFEIMNNSITSSVVERKEEHNQRLIERFCGKNPKRQAYLSPSAINTWLNCRMKFYYRYVNGLFEREEISEEIDPAKLGTLLHAVAKDLYAGYADGFLDKTALGKLSADKDRLLNLIKKEIRQVFGKPNYSVVNGNELIISNVLSVFIDRILQMDKNVAPLKIISLENLYLFPIRISGDTGIINVMTGGKIDRIDLKGEVVRIIDYKTGKVADSVKTVNDLFQDDRNKELDGWLQTLLYCEAFLWSDSSVRIIPSIYKLNRVPKEDDTGKMRFGTTTFLEDYNEVRDDFINNLHEILKIIFSGDEPFIMTKDVWSKCSYCPYRKLCGR